MGSLELHLFVHDGCMAIRVVSDSTHGQHITISQRVPFSSVICISLW